MTFPDVPAAAPLMRTPRRQVVAIPKQEGDSSRTVRKIGDSQVKWSIDLTREFNAAGVAAYPTVLLFRALRSSACHRSSNSLFEIAGSRERSRFAGVRFSVA